MGRDRHDHTRRPSSNTAIASFAKALSREFEINRKTLAKWRWREMVEDRKTGPKQQRSSVLSEAMAALIAAFRRHMLLPLSGRLDALQPTVPQPRVLKGSRSTRFNRRGVYVSESCQRQTLVAHRQR